MQGGREATKGAVCPALSAGKTENHDRREPFQGNKNGRESDRKIAITCENEINTKIKAQKA